MTTISLIYSVKMDECDRAVKNEVMIWHVWAQNSQKETDCLIQFTNLSLIFDFYSFLLTNRLSRIPLRRRSVNLLSFMEISFIGERSTTSDSVGSPTDNRDITTTTVVPLVCVSLLQEGLPHDEFTFLVNHKPFSTSAVEAMLLSLVVCEQLQVDACARRFVICDLEIDSTDLISLQSLLSGLKIILQMSYQKSLSRLNRQLGNIGLKRHFFCLWSHSTVNATIILSNVFATHSRVSLQSISDISLLSADALDSLLSNESFLVDSQNALLRLLVRLGHLDLLRHIQWDFVSTAGIASLCEDLTESLWLAVAHWLMHLPPPSGFDSMIVSEFPPLFEEFQSAVTS
jgi:hypothetical protein